MGQGKQTSSVTPLRAMSRAVSITAVGLLVAPAAFAQQTTYQQESGSTANSRTVATQRVATNNAAQDSGDTDDAATAPANARDQDTAAAPAPTTQPDDETTGSILDEDMRKLNTREPRLDETPARRVPESISTEQTPGIPLGSFVLRPSVTQTINTETTKDGGTKKSRGFLETDMGATLTSDWSRHQLTVTSEGAWQKNISGEGEEQPSFKINGDLRLDLTRDTVGHITGGYNFYREDTDDPDAITDAAQQSDVQEFTGGASIEHDFGILRGTAA